jgi:hypothetical protein
MYISFNNFNIGNGVVQITYSDNGTSWSSPFTLNTGFLQNVQVTGDLLGSGNVYVATMYFAGGELSPHTNYMYRSTDGGATWASSVMGPAVEGPGRATSSGYALAFSTIWRSAGWGEPAAVGNNVYYDWAQCGQNVVCSGVTDHGDIYFQRSTDSGATWSSPLKLNTDMGTAMQWQPSLAATRAGAIYAGWYDERQANGGADLDCTPGNMAQLCYQRWGRVSLDGGVTWEADSAVSDVLSPLPAQPDGTITSLYEGDYDYITSDGDTVYDHWTDGRAAINNTSQQDVFLDRINLAVGTPTPTSTGLPLTGTPTSSPTNTSTQTPTLGVPTGTDTPTAEPPTSTSTLEVPTNTATPLQTTATATVTATAAARATATACTLAFSDVPSGSTFYTYVHCLACLGIINGYSDGTFKPNNNVTRGQLSKIVSNAAGFDDDQTTQMFHDVPVGTTFFQYIGRLASRGFINGYACGGPGEPCGPGNLPYFRPNANSTRGQISKIVSNAAGFSETPSGQQFQDVPSSNAFYAYIYRLVLHNVMSGYPCDTPPAGRCIPPDNLPYFVPNNNATRGQTSKIVANTFFPNCDIPANIEH